MPQIIVTARDDETTVLLRERINASDFESEKFAANLVERLGWAVVDAAEAEHDEPAARPRRRAADRKRPITGDRRRASQSEPQHEPHLEPVGSA
jgi:hypothetical protein